MKKSGYKVSLKYTPAQNEGENNQQKEQRKQKIMGFNPPYSVNVKTNIRNLFLKLLDRHFSRAYKFHKMFAWNMAKVSYYCMKSLGSKISCHHKQVLQTCYTRYGCNCSMKESGTLDNKGISPSILRSSNY